MPTARRVGRFMANWRAGLAIFELQTKHDRRSVGVAPTPADGLLPEIVWGAGGYVC